MRQIDCRVHYHYNGGHPRRRLYLTQLIDDGNFGRKREKAGNYRSTQKGKGEKKKEEREGDNKNGERELGHTNGLISQQCDLFALYSHKEPTLLCHYVTKEGVIAQQGPPVRHLPPTRGDVWCTVMGTVLSLLSRSSLSSIIDHPRGHANMPVIFPPFRISLYYFLPARHGYRR